MCKIADTERVTVSLRNMELIAAGQTAHFDIQVNNNNSGSNGNSELAVTVRGPSSGNGSNLPVKVAAIAGGKAFRAEFTPRQVGSHTINVEYNGTAVTGTPFVAKVYDAGQVYVSPMAAGVLRKNLQFTGSFLIVFSIRFYIRIQFIFQIF